ncbi:MAG: DinB family protein [Acidobacteriota bacterium]
MKRTDIKELPEYFERYINLVDDIELSKAFDQSLKQIDDLDIEKLNRIGLKVYEAEKWTINSVIAHLTDWERILAYRALVYARKAGIIPHGMDEQILANNSNADSRKIEEILGELRIVRLSTKTLFDSFNNEILETKGAIWKYEMSVLAMGFNIIGHQVHHFGIIEERYFPLDK